MSSHIDVEQPANSCFTGFLTKERIWIVLGWGLCVVMLLGSSPLLFHAQEYLFFSLLGVAVVLSLLQQKRLWVSSPIYIPFLCFVGWVALTIPFSSDPWISLNEWQKVVAQLAVFCGTCVIVKEQPEEHFELKILFAILIGVIACCTYSLLDFWDRGGILWDREIRAGFPKPDGADFTWLSTNVLMVLPLLMAGLVACKVLIHRVFLAGGVLLASLALIFSYSRAVWLAVFAQILASGFILRKRMLLRLLVFGLVCCVILSAVFLQMGLHRSTFDPWTIKARVVLWKMSIHDVLEHPLTGIGYGVPILEKRHAGHILALEASNPTIPDIPEKPHNWYLMILTGTGLPGFMLFLWLLTKVGTSVFAGFAQMTDPIHRWWLLGTFVMVLGFSIRIFFDDSFGGSHSYLFWMVVGISMVISSRFVNTQTSRQASALNISHDS